MKIKKCHFELYEYMKRKHENKEQFTKSDLLEIYAKYVMPNKRLADNQRLEESQIYLNASQWLNNAIAVLIRRGYLGLTFRKNGTMQVKEQEIV